MFNSTQLFTLLILLVIFVHANDKQDCSPKILAPKVTKCVNTLKHLTNITTAGKVDYKKIGKGVIKDCKKFEECSSALKCLNDTSLEDITKKLITNCDAAEYFITVFPKCNDKLQVLNSTCLAEWNPFPKIEDGGNGTLEDAQEEACKNFSGKDDCVKKAVIETCGEDEWKTFNKHQTNIAKILGVCNFE